MIVCVDSPRDEDGGPPLMSDERWARDRSGLCGRHCQSSHWGSGHGDFTLCVQEIGHDGPHLCGRQDHPEVSE